MVGEGFVGFYTSMSLANTFEAIVEKVVSGDRLIVRLMTEPNRHTQTMLLIAGIRAPSTKRVNPSDGTEQAAEPCGEEAQLFVETRLLQRSVTVNVLGVSPQNVLVGAIKHPTQGTIAPFILRSGLARCTDHHSTMLGSDMGALRQAEREARDKRLGVFQGHTGPAAARGGDSEAVVSRIQSADTVYLRNRNGAERRISLSSVRQPKPSDPKQAPWGAEAKEFLRKRLIGKHVKFSIDGKRAATEGYDEREMATIQQNNKNVGLMLVEAGLASVIRHRQDDPDRSPIYDELLQTEAEAQKEGRGMWGSKGPETKAYVDYSESVEKAKRELSILQRQKKVPAIVDFVKAGSRFTVLIPRENAKLTFVLSGIRAPKTARNAADKSEPFGQEAADFANKRCLQRDVELDVEDIDKVGGFIGALYINRENFAKLLLEEGFASVHEYSAEKTGNARELFAAEQQAKEQRKGMWHSWSPADDEADNTGAGATAMNGTANGEPQERKKDYRDVVVTHINPETCGLKVQLIGSGTSSLSSLMNQFRSFHLSGDNNKPLPNPPKRGDIVSAKFSEDGEWYRARVLRVDRENKKAEVVYIDYGNGETVPWSQLRELNSQFSTDRLKAQAVDATLSFLQMPANQEYRADCVDWIAREAADRQLVANVDATDKDGTLFVTLFDPKNSSSLEHSLNADIVDAGMAMVARKLRPWERSAGKALEDLKKREETAKDERRGMWEYGDLTDD